MRFDIKTTVIVLLALAIVLLSTCKSCSEKKYEKEIDNLRSKLNNCNDVKQSVDTQYILIPQQAAIAENLFKKAEFKPTKREIDSFIAFQVDTSAVNTEKERADKWRNAYYDLAESYNMEKQYEDTAIFLNGIAIVKTRVKQNEIQEQKTILDSIRQDVVTITKQVLVPKRKAGLYFGLSAYSDQKFSLNGAGASLLYHSPRALNYEIGATFNSYSKTNYFLSIKFPLTKK